MSQIAQRQQYSTAPQSRWLDVHPSLGISLMDHLFNRLDGAYPNRWKSSFKGEQAIANWRESWAEIFEEEGLSFEEVKFGLKECRVKYEWPPSIAEFVKACRPQVNYDAALYEAVEQMRLRSEGRDEWKNPAIFWAAVAVGEYDMLNMSHGQLINRFTHAYEKVIRGKIDPVPARALSLPAPGKSYAAPEVVQREIEKVRALQKPIGNKDWAHRILERVKNGEKLAYMTVKMAKQALGIKEEAAA